MFSFQQQKAHEPTQFDLRARFTFILNILTTKKNVL